MNPPHAHRPRPWYRQPVFIATVVGEAGVLVLFMAIALLILSLR